MLFFILAPPVDPINRRRSRSVGDEEHCFNNPNTANLLNPELPTLGYNDRVVAFLRQEKIFHVLKEKHSSIGSQKSLKEKIVIIRQEGTAALNRLSHDVELTLLLRYVP